MIYHGAVEHDVLQNEALGGLAIWMFSNEYFRAKGKTSGVPLPAAMIVLPIVFHEDSVKSLATRNFDGGLYSALSDNRALFAGLQGRMESMADQSLASLNMAFASHIIDLDTTSGSLIPLRSTEPKEVMTESVTRILATAKRLGYWASQLGTAQLLNLLGVRI